MRRTLVVVGVVACVSLAGCNALPGSSSGLSSAEYPEHANADGFSDTEAFVSQMEATLEGEDYSLNISLEESNASGTTAYVYRDLARNGNQTRYKHELYRIPGEDEATGWYHDGDTGYRMHSGSVRTTESFDWSSQTYDTLVTQLEPLTLSASETRSADDRTLIVYEVTDYENRSDVTADGEVVIDEQGLLHSFDITMGFTDSEFRTDVTFSLMLEEPEITAPEWVTEDGTSGGS